MVKGKGGASHFEMIISFIFFMGFIFFLFLFLKPYDDTVLSGSVVAALYDTFEENAHTNLTNIFLRAETPVLNPSGCLYIQLPGEIFAYALTESRVTNLADIHRTSDLEMPAGNLNIAGTDDYYKVAISPEFNDGPLGGCDLVTTPYILGSKLERRVISYSALKTMQEKYNINYDILKQDLRIPATFDFFIVSEEFPEINMEKFISNSVDVIALDYVLDVLKEDGQLNSSRFTLGVW
jgi:hypothetical protein